MTKLLKPFGTEKYISPEEALKEIAKLPDAPEVPEPKQPVGTFDFELGNATKRWDPDPAKNGEWKDQDRWIEYLNKENKIMIAMPDLYRAGKLAGDGFLENLRRDFDESWVVTSTMLVYNQNDLDARIIHYYGSNIVEPAEFKVLVPDYSNSVYFNDVLGTGEGLMYLQALFGTIDNRELIKETIERLSNYDSGKIYVWTPNPEMRITMSRRGIAITDNEGKFRIDGDNVRFTGRSRGMLPIDHNIKGIKWRNS